MARLNLSQLPGALAKGLAPLYVVGGEEPLLAQEALDAIRAKARAVGYSEREVLDADKGFEWGLLLDACNAMSLFASLRIVELRLNNAPDVAGGKILQQLAASPPRDVLLLIHVGKLEWKTRSGGWFSALEAAGASLYFEAMKPGELPGWIGGRLKAAGLDADPDALQLLAERTEGNLLAAQQEVQKLVLLHGKGSRLGLEAIDSAVADSAYIDVFGWINKVMAGDGRGAMRGLDALRGEGMDIVPITLLLAGGLRQLAKVVNLAARTGNVASAVEAAYIHKANQSAYARAAERASVNQVLGWLRQCAKVDALAKSSGGQPQAWEELLTLIMSVAGTGRKKAATTRR
mgnify:CR=1 FL=1